MSLTTLKPEGRIQQGTVVSTKMDKTVIVRIDWTVKHPLYGKIMRRATRLAVHDEANLCKEGDKVMIRECKPYSKTKAWTLLEVLEKAS